MYIPNGIIFTGLIGGSIMKLVLGTSGLGGIFLGIFAGAFPMLAIYLLRPGGMGAGDVKLAAVMGGILGWQHVLLALFLSFFLGAFAGIFLVLLGQKGLKDPMPFGPFLAMGGMLSMTLGGWIIPWYSSLILI